MTPFLKLLFWQLPAVTETPPKSISMLITGPHIFTSHVVTCINNLVSIISQVGQCRKDIMETKPEREEECAPKPHSDFRGQTDGRRQQMCREAACISVILHCLAKLLALLAQDNSCFQEQRPRKGRRQLPQDDNFLRKTPRALSVDDNMLK